MNESKLPTIYLTFTHIRFLPFPRRTTIIDKNIECLSNIQIEMKSMI